MDPSDPASYFGETLEEFKNRWIRHFDQVIKEKQAEHQATIQKRKDRDSEVEKLKESISKLKKEKKQLTKELVSAKQKGEKAVKKAKQGLAAAQKEFDRSQTKLEAKENSRDKMKETLDNFSKYLGDIKQDEEMLIWWQKAHSLNIYSHENETRIEIHNVNPYNPSQRFHVLLDSIACGNGIFRVLGVIPDFEEAPIFIEQANESKDMLKLLTNCRKHWRRDCIASSSNLSINQSMNSEELETTIELFPSPMSDSKND